MIQLLDYILSDFRHFVGTVLFIWLTVLPVLALIRPIFTFSQIIKNGEQSNSGEK